MLTYVLKLLKCFMWLLIIKRQPEGDDLPTEAEILLYLFAEIFLPSAVGAKQKENSPFEKIAI
jgi:hypothetical protein